MRELLTGTCTYIALCSALRIVEVTYSVQSIYAVNLHCAPLRELKGYTALPPCPRECIDSGHCNYTVYL